LQLLGDVTDRVFPRKQDVHKILQMDKTYISRADYVAVHDGVYVHVGRRARLF